MESTQEFVKKIHELQEKSEQSKQKSSKENSSHKLASKQHSTNK